MIKPWLCRTDLKHSSRRPRAKQPAWYSFPSIIDGTISVSCTMTAISLSRFPSMLRSLMLAEPKRRTSRQAQVSSRDSHHQYNRSHSMLPGSRCSSQRWRPPEGEPKDELYRSRPASVMPPSLSETSLEDATQHGSGPCIMKTSFWGLLRKKNIVSSFPAFEYGLQKIHPTAICNHEGLTQPNEVDGQKAD